jgi:hypothetical protein
MARQRNDLPTQELRVSTTPQVVELLRSLVSTGLFGKNPAEATERILAEKLRELIAEGAVKTKK